MKCITLYHSILYYTILYYTMIMYCTILYHNVQCSFQRRDDHLLRMCHPSLNQRESGYPHSLFLLERGWLSPPLITCLKVEGVVFPHLLLFLENGWSPPPRTVLQYIILSYTVLSNVTLYYTVVRESDYPHPLLLFERGWPSPPLISCLKVEGMVIPHLLLAQAAIILKQLCDMHASQTKLCSFVFELWRL